MAKTNEAYIPRVFGFRVNKDAYTRSLTARKKASNAKRAKVASEAKEKEAAPGK